MRNARTAWAAAIGQAPSRELLEIQRDHDPATVRRVRRMVRRGRAAADVREARLALAIAHDLQRAQRLSGTRTMVSFALIVVAWIGTAAWQFADGRPVLGAFFAVTAAWGVFLLVRLPIWRRNAAQAERLNRELLQSAGEETPSHHEGVARPSRPALIGGVAAALVFYTVVFGALTLAMDGNRLTVGHILERGALFGVLMTVVNLTVIRRRNERAARGGVPFSP